jgi:hypothetical protein
VALVSLRGRAPGPGIGDHHLLPSRTQKWRLVPESPLSGYPARQ